MKPSRIFIFFLPLFLMSCAKKNYFSDFAIKNERIPIFIEMPSNPLVFDNISPLIYQALHHHYLRVGYTIVDKPSDGYSLRIKAKSLEPTNKLVSQDIVLMHYTIKMELECSLLNFNQEVVVKKTFFFSSLISKSKNPILNSDFLDFEYKRLLERSAPRIERFFRSHLLQAFKENGI
jgi:hypothetical protein